MGMLLYGLPAKAGTRHNVGLMITQCLSQKLSPASPSPSGHYLTLMEELLPVCHFCSCCHSVRHAWLHCLVLRYTVSCCADEHAVPRYAVLCCAVLCCAVLCCAVLCCAVLCCAVHYGHSG